MYIGKYSINDFMNSNMSAEWENSTLDHVDTPPASPRVEETASMDILQSHGLARIAARLCTEMSLSTMSDLAKLTDEEIDAISWLKRIQTKKLKALCEACREGDPNLRESISNARFRDSRDVGDLLMQLANLNNLL